MGLSDIETIPETGAVFTFGRSRFADNVASHFFIRKDPVISICCGDEHSAVICQSGRLFIFGSNDWGQLGLGHKNHVSKPSCVKILKPEKVTHVACGRAHTLICTGAQKIFACGCDQEAQLGRGSSAVGDSATSPVLVYDCGLAGPRVIDIAAGSHHSLALTSDGRVFAWGSNLEGQLGLPGISGLVNKPTTVHIPEPVKQISTGYYHSAFLTESGLVYVCGESESGKLGIDVNFSSQVAPKQMQLPCPAVRVTCGGHHTLILAENGNVYCAGSNASGQLGMGSNVTEIQTPKLLPRGALQNETIARIACGESHSAIVTETGKLFTCGDGRHGKLGLEENENNVHELTFALKYEELFVSNVACGGCHTILVAHKRDMNNPSQRETDSTQVDHVQKKTSLPPLKLPGNRLQNETHSEKINENDKATLDQEMNNIESTTVTTENIDKTVKENGEENNKNTVTDAMNNIERIETDEHKSEDTTADVSSKKANESTLPNDNNTEKNGHEKLVSNINSENSVHEVEKTEIANKGEDEKNSEENNKELNKESNKELNKEDNKEYSKENNKEHNKENNKEINDENTIHDKESSKEHNRESDKENRGNNKRHVDNDKIETLNEVESNDNTETKMSPEKQVLSSSSSPPPKPPRLKPGSGDSSSSARISSAEHEDDNKNSVHVNDDTSNKKSVNKDAPVDNASESSKKHTSESSKSLSNSGDSRSSKSRVDTDETIEIDKQKDEADGARKIVEAKKTSHDVTDDADVIQSPAPRASRMSKIFKAKRQQEMENGTKRTSTTNHKAKSKTCTVL